jgi:ubiquinone/menaquinone biosynthesis C-methylase UbiE/glycosyltransferase involved in cell wall biosynthesis
MDYKKEYDEYWSRADRWGSHSFKNADSLAAQILSVCGEGNKILDVGFGMGLLVKTLLVRGCDAHGLEVAEKAVTEAERFAPGHFKTGSILGIPYSDEAFQTVVSTDCLEHIEEKDVPQALSELYRVTQRHVFIQLTTTPNREKRWQLTIRDRAWWEMRFFEAGFRKHPAIQSLLPYESLEQEGRQITLVFEKISRLALEKYPLAALKAERDLHMDMLRESGRRSDAHIARYTLARQYLPDEGLVLDAACGLGYGSAILAQGSAKVRVVGIDSSDFAIDYARSNFPSQLPKVEFRTGDVCNLAEFEDESVGLVVSFETVEHLREPEQFLKEVKRVLKPGGRFIASVPDMWVDETGKDPNPHHFHVFDFSRLAALCQKFLFLQDAFRQNAGGGMKLTGARRELRQVNLPVTNDGNGAEWWIMVARKGEPALSENRLQPGSNQLVLLTADPQHPLYSSWLPHWKLPWLAIDPAKADARSLSDAAMVVTHDTYLEPGRKAIGEAMALGIPTLILADGILEYRNTWEHPQLAPGALFQPVLGHKIACLGRSQARYLESWGNAGKCEIVGSPRFDRYYELKRRQKRAEEPRRLLIMTALTPYFTERQHHLVRSSLRDLKEFFDGQQHIGGFGIETIWRLTKGLGEEIGVESRFTDLTGRELGEVLQGVDGVITTPSTSMLEAMMLGLPVAVLDYGNSPQYVQAAWRITAQEQIPEVMAELMNPPEPKMLFQETTLHDSLECSTPATPRLLSVITEMMQRGREAKEQGRPVQIPFRILDLDTNRVNARENRFRLETLYPEQPLAHKKIPGDSVAHPPAQRPVITGAGQSNGHQNGNHFHAPRIKTGADPVSLLEPSLSRAGKRKLLFVSHDASRTGAPIFLLNLIRWIRENDKWDVRIVLRSGGVLERQFCELGETVVCATIEPGSPLLEDVSLIYSNTATNGLFLRCLSPGLIPVITHVHELRYTIESFGKENFEEVRRHTSHFIACSNAVAAGLRQHYQIPEDKVTVIHEGIPLHSVIEGASAKTIREVKQWCGLEADTALVAACGFAGLRKGPDLFLQVADSMRRRMGNRRKVSFLWIGLLPEDERGRILLHDLEQLGLSGFVKLLT